MNRTELIGKISEVAEMSRQEAEKALNSTLYAISSAVKGGDAVRITGFGTFKLRPRAARTGRNPQTGGEITISGRRVLTFKSSQVLKKSMNPEASG